MEREAQVKPREERRQKPFSDRYWGPEEAKLYGLVSKSGQPYGAPPASRLWGPEDIAKYGLDFDKYGSYNLPDRPSTAGESANVPVLREPKKVSRLLMRQSGLTRRKHPRPAETESMRKRRVLSYVGVHGPIGSGVQLELDPDHFTKSLMPTTEQQQEARKEAEEEAKKQAERQARKQEREQKKAAALAAAPWLTYRMEGKTLARTNTDYKGVFSLIIAIEVQSTKSHTDRPLRHRSPCANPHCGVTLALDWRPVDGRTFCDRCGGEYRETRTYRTPKFWEKYNKQCGESEIADMPVWAEGEGDAASED